MPFIGSVLFSLYLMVTTIIVALICFVLFPFPYHLRYLVINLYATSVVKVLSFLCGLKYTIEGAENIPDEPVIVFCKHQSTWETFVVQMIFPALSFVFKQELFWIPFFGWGLAAMKPVAIKRGSGKKAVKQLVTKGRQRLEEGLCVVIFPEGTRTNPTGPGRYRIGGALLAAESGYSVVPVAHHAGEFWPRKSFIKRPGHVTVRVGPLITTKDKTAEAILEEAKNWIEAQMPEITQGRYTQNS